MYRTILLFIAFLLGALSTSILAELTDSPLPSISALGLGHTPDVPSPQDRIPEVILPLDILAAVENFQSSLVAFNEACVGRAMPVLFDRAGRHDGQLVGRSPYMQPVHAAAPADALGRILDVCITSVHANSLGGEIALPPPHHADAARQRIRA